LSLNELKGLMVKTAPTQVVAGFWPLWGLSSPEPDLSGNRNDGTVTGAVRSNHPPITLFTPKWAATMPWISPTDFAEQNKRRSAFSPLPLLVLPPVPDGVID
jgi:hypothetical protein